MIELSYTDRTYSKKEFLRYIEHRIRKDVRLNKPIKPLDTVHVFNDGSKEFFVAKHFLERVFGKNLTVKEAKDKKVKGILVVPTNLEREISENLRSFLENVDIVSSEIKILDNVLEEEIVKVCELLGKNVKEEEEVNPLIEKMEAKYPGTKFSLHRAFQKLQLQQ